MDKAFTVDIGTGLTNDRIIAIAKDISDVTIKAVYHAFLEDTEVNLNRYLPKEKVTEFSVHEIDYNAVDDDNRPITIDIA